MSFDNDQNGCEKIGPSPHKIMIMAFPFKEGSETLRLIAYAWLYYKYANKNHANSSYGTVVKFLTRPSLAEPRSSNW